MAYGMSDVGFPFPFAILCVSVVSCAVRTRSCCCEGRSPGSPPTARISLPSGLAAYPLRSSGRPPARCSRVLGSAFCVRLWQTQNGDISASTGGLAHCLRHQPTGARSGGQSTTREQPLRPTLAPTPRCTLTAPKGETRIALGDPLKGRPWVHDSFCDTRGRSGLCFFPSSKKKRHQYRFRCHQTSIY